MGQVHETGSRTRSQESSEVKNRKKETGVEERNKNIFPEKPDVRYLSAVSIPLSIHKAALLCFEESGILIVPNLSLHSFLAV